MKKEILNMYYVTKVFSIPMAHRLSNLVDSRCFYYHGHNYKIEITVKSMVLNKNYMVIDFSELKKITEIILDNWDHGMMVNKDSSFHGEFCRTIYVDGEPTAEYMAFTLFNEIQKLLPENVRMDSVTVWETDTSKAVYCPAV
jgi:6-pyruvoyltetrahydropterin/6-carboxytetrahydropterin synthase